MRKDCFEWDPDKDRVNQEKHGVSFQHAQYAFADPRRVIAADLSYSEDEARYYCFGKTADGNLTVRFTWRDGVIRIIGAGYWRRGKQVYEQENQIHR
jgi:uncharacterized DUF497 family protein